MKNIIIPLLLTAGTNLFAQDDQVSSNMPLYKIELITANENRLKGLLLDVSDTSVLIYPGKRKEWRSKTIYTPVEFHYTNIQLVKLKKKNGAWRGMLIGGAIGTTIFAGSLLFPNRMEKNHHAFFTFPAIPLGFISGAIIGGKNKKKFHINGCRPVFNEFQKRLQ